MKKGFLKFSDERNKKYSIRTEIDFTSDNKGVLKKPVFEEGFEHLDKIILAYDKLKKYYDPVEVCGVKKDTEGIVFEFIKGETYLDKLLLAVQKENVEEYESLLLRQKEIICGNEENQCIFETSEQFEQWFGNSAAYEGKPGLLYSNFDAIAANIIICDEKPVFIDYEWTCDFKMPRDLVVYHCVYDAYIHNSKLDEFYSMDKAIELLGIETSREILDESYKKFFDCVICDENGASYAKDKFQCLKPVFSFDYVNTEWQKCANSWKEAVDANEEMKKELDYARTEWKKCADLWKDAVDANSELQKQLAFANEEWQKAAKEWQNSVSIINTIRGEHEDLVATYTDLAARYEALERQHNEVINSKVWKANVKLHNIFK